MKIMNEYTYHKIKKNKRYTISILVAITIASALLCSLSIFLYSIWDTKVTSTIEKTGYWHGELWNSISGDKLKYITENPDVEATMVKGSWVTAELSNTKRPYLLMRDADKNFWSDMNLKNNLTDGSLPKKAGEIVVSKLFFTDNPTYKIGDKLTLPIGNRMLDNKVISTQDYKKPGETFKTTGTKTYTIVGELDVSGISAYPGYIAMGYLDVLNIQPSDELTVYMRFVNPRKIYNTLPEIAEYVGLTKNEYGQYGVMYNSQLLNLYGISDKSSTNTQLVIILAIAVTLFLLIMGAFVLIIYNAFSLSSNSRIKELSILKSLGATPRQIKYSVLYEGFLLWIAQLPIGLIIGYTFSYLVFSRVNGILSISEDYKNINVSLSWVVIAFSVISSLITVLVSAYIPARKVAKVPAIFGIRQNSQVIKVKKMKRNLIIKRIFGIEGELAASQFSANKKSLRTAVLSLSMCFILISGYINIISIYNFADSKNNKVINHDITLNLNIMDEPSDKMLNEILSLPEAQDSVVRRQVCTSTYVTSDQESDIFAESGGFDGVNSNKYNVLKEDGKYRITVNLVGLGDESFKKYCTEIGTDFEKYYKEGTATGVLLNSTYHTPANSKVIQQIHLLNINQGSKMLLYEKVEDDMNTNNKFDVQIGDVTDISPSDLGTARYSLAFIVPMKNYQQIVSDFSPDRKLESNRVSIDLLVGDKASPNVKEKLTQICSAYLGSEDFNIWSLVEERNHKELVQKAVAISVSAVALMIGIIGIFNAFSIVSNNIRLHRKEFAMLRSVGLTPKGLNKMLILEGLFFALKPIIISIPVVFIICWYMLRLTSITWIEFLAVFPGKAISIYSMLIFVAILLSYWFSSKSVKQNNIIEAMKDEIV
ncbi:ABC transporter permease [Clostridium saccharobutylicum]|uniref:Putative permease n=2 Tax=Clostridium saccharobutylicum TaxID=169679 RepID=U5MQD7_CLOSA|nr:ABC transporter permease [Clostridium saccharobutylicum]AGX41647.1 putative permease [Clostridium saccharobutylicum DSM 13864]AQR88929.1 ABC transporter permease YtrF precursor [Clostridium saccharobutylicum]AQR98830.1 ABC transporter permease YtrF precursor [Clostridium saccharobutylicum]AQS12818.1 ABC transporter permease YtrF precursor [Clostridium saccharobutylicum]MBA2904069.1 putative ABC transport system permease protein [Clostridium saccharobutylicum]